MRAISLLLILVLPLGLLPARATAQAQSPPVAAARNVTDTYFGTEVVDPYRWMEKADDPQFLSWIKAQDGYTRATLERLTDYKPLAARVRALGGEQTRVSEVKIVGRDLFYAKLAPGSNNYKLYLRAGGPEGRERLLLDPGRLDAAGSHYALAGFSPSRDGRFVLYGLQRGGLDNTSLHVLDVSRGRSLPEKIDYVDTFASLVWHPDGRSFFYLRNPAPANPGEDPDTTKGRIFYHVLGTDPKDDRPIFGTDLSPHIAFTASDLPDFAISPDGRHAFGLVMHGFTLTYSIYTAPLDALSGAMTPWRQICGAEDEVIGFAPRGDDLYLLARRGAARGRILRTSIAKPEMARASVVVPETGAVLNEMRPAEDALYVLEQDGAIVRLVRVPYASAPATARAETVKFPFDATVQEFAVSPHRPGVIAQIASWTNPPQIYRYDPLAGRASNTRLIPPAREDSAGIESVEVEARSADGTMVPLSIIYQRGLKLDGTHPTRLDGYGSYGIPIVPEYRATMLAWLERGGIYAAAHVRGGGEYGEEWHRAGMKEKKQNSIDDYIACAEYLVAHKYTSPRHLGAYGWSAGGIVVGGAINQRPELFGAAVLRDCDFNSLRFELTLYGEANTTEFGTVKTAEGFRAVYQVDAYQHVRDGAAYPAVMLITGMNDQIVPPWQSGKMAARLQKATSSGRPVLLRVDYNAGHGYGATRAQGLAEATDTYAFLLWQLGHP